MGPPGRRDAAVGTACAREAGIHVSPRPMASPLSVSRLSTRLVTPGALTVRLSAVGAALLTVLLF